MVRLGERRWEWKIGRGRRMARERHALESTARYDAVTDWSDGRSTFTEKPMVSSWALRYWRSGPRFRDRMLRSTALTIATAAAAVVLAALFS